MAKPDPVVVGIDPGKKGAVAVLQGARVLLLADAPVDPSSNDYNVAAAAVLLEPYRGALAAIEDQRSIPHKTKDNRMVIPASDIVLGESLGIWRGVTGTLGMTTKLVPPITWQHEMMRNLPAIGKQYRGITMARALFPQVAAKLHGPKGGELDGRADALLIACWLQRQVRVHGLDFMYRAAA